MTFTAKKKKDDESAEDPKEEATESKAEEAKEDAAEPDAPKKKHGKGGRASADIVAAIEKRKGPVGKGHHNAHRTAALMKWLQSKQKD
jgi:hypothetical protein